MDKQGNIYRKRNVSAAMFAEMNRRGNIDRKRNVSATMFAEITDRETLTGNVMFPGQCFQK